MSKRKFLPVQSEAWEYAKDRKRVAFYMAMRLGKTLVTIRWVASKFRVAKTDEYLFSDNPPRTLIVAPMSVLPGWKDELALEGYDSVILSGTSHQKKRQLEDAIVNRTQWILVNPEGLRACKELATLIKWKCVILDESTFIMSPKAQISKMCVHLFRDVEFKAVLAGEPAPETPLNYFMQMKFLFGEFMGSDNYWLWLKRHFYEAGYDWIPFKGVLKRIRDEIRSLAFIKTAAQAGIANQRVYEKRVVRMSSQFRALYKQCEKEFAVGTRETKYAVGVTTWLSQLAGGTISTTDDGGLSTSPHKVNEVLSLLRGELKAQPCVVWFRFNSEIDHLRRALDKNGIRSRTVTGRTPLALRHAYVKSFHENKFQVFLVQTRCARFGLNLSCANIAIFYSNYWDWLTRSQAEARTQHPMKKIPSLIIDLITSDTMDAAVVKTLRERKRDSRYFLQRVLVHYRGAKK